MSLKRSFNLIFALLTGAAVWLGALSLPAEAASPTEAAGRPAVLPEFRDIASHWAKAEITALLRKNYIDGYRDETTGQLDFKPDQPITRAEFVRYLVKAKELPLSGSTESDLTDIGKNKEDLAYIMTAVDYGLVNGYPDHTFRPDSTISRAEIAAILERSEMLKSGKETAFRDVPAGPEDDAGRSGRRHLPIVQSRAAGHERLILPMEKQ
ncbi:Cellulosome-anchoring protein precursor [Paenibacillus konkukensis]|uniref:Cellulosome-anchoring protein n=1 Tax=Paenibacillus konkukensis TaxID=2020716 RepID=A0ABY4RY58_9BACL|nr:S-layer homology domain-containing protein [Paenibacillus konkukensis]UQZ87168.1 Cellulosome-anchoring protein precursor [Paenibacillus konkukensis]